MTAQAPGAEPTLVDALTGLVDVSVGTDADVDRVLREAAARPQESLAERLGPEDTETVLRFVRQYVSPDGTDRLTDDERAAFRRLLALPRA